MNVNIVTGRVAKADILRGVEAHPKFLLDGLIIRDEDGLRLTGKVTKVELPPMPDDWVLLDDLLATTIVYQLNFRCQTARTAELPAAFQRGVVSMPVMTELTVTREGVTRRR